MIPLKESLINKSNIKKAKTLDLELKAFALIALTSIAIFTTSMRAFGDAVEKIKSAIPVANAVGTMYLIVPKDDLYAAKKIITKQTSSYKEYKSKVSDVDELELLIKTNISTGFYDFCE